MCFCSISALCLATVPFYLSINWFIFRETKQLWTRAEIEKMSWWKYPSVMLICCRQTGSHECAFYIALCVLQASTLQSIHVHILIWLVFWTEEYTLLITFTLAFFKVNHSVSRTYWTWLAGSITMRCPYNGRVPIPDLPIYLAVLMSAY